MLIELSDSLFSYKKSATLVDPGEMKHTSTESHSHRECFLMYKNM